jgi:hypothetical protein
VGGGTPRAARALRVSVVRAPRDLAGVRLGEQGAVSVRLAVYNATICLVCAHLAAGKECVAQCRAPVICIVYRPLYVLFIAPIILCVELVCAIRMYGFQ